MFLSGLFITMPYSVSYSAFAVTAKLDRTQPIVMNRFRDLHSSHTLYFWPTVPETGLQKVGPSFAHHTPETGTRNMAFPISSICFDG